MRDFGLNSIQYSPDLFHTDILRKNPFEDQCLHQPHCENMMLQFQGTLNLVLVGFVCLCVKTFSIQLTVQYSMNTSYVSQKPQPNSCCNITLYFLPCNYLLRLLTSFYLLFLRNTKIACLTFWPWSWTFTVQHTIYVKCEYYMNQEE